MSSAGSAVIFSKNRLQIEEMKLLTDPPPNILVRRNTPLQFHFCFYGLGAPFQGGVYHGIIKLEESYPFTGPKICFLTPNGRFTPQVFICTSFTSYHPESWSPSWTIRSTLLGLVSFMFENDVVSIGSQNSDNSAKQKYARQSLSFNCKNSVFVELFGQHFKENQIKREQPLAIAEQRQQQLSVSLIANPHHLIAVQNNQRNQNRKYLVIFGVFLIVGVAVTSIIVFK